MNSTLVHGGIPAPKLDVRKFELACGAKLLVSARPGAPVCAIQFHLRGGLADAPAGAEGTANLVGMLADQGTSKHDEEGLAALLEPAGGEVRGDAFGVAGTIVGTQWKLLARTMSEIVTDARYPVREAERRSPARLATGSSARPTPSLTCAR